VHHTQGDVSYLFQHRGKYWSRMSTLVSTSSTHTSGVACTHGPHSHQAWVKRVQAL